MLSNSKGYKEVDNLENEPASNLSSDLEIERQASRLRFGSTGSGRKGSKKKKFNSANLEDLISDQIQYCLDNEDAFYWEDIFNRRLNVDCISKEHKIYKAYNKIKTNYFK